MSTTSDPRASAVLSQLSHRRLLANTIVPTNDADVRTRLRALLEPITLFGEGPAERRDRLRELVATANQAQNQEGAGPDGVDADGDIGIGDAPPAAGIDDGDGADKEVQEEFYTEGTAALLAARQDIARYSLRRTRGSILYQKSQQSIPLRTHVKSRNAIKARVREFELVGSQTTERPVGSVRLNPRGDRVAVGDWGGRVRVMNVPGMETAQACVGHNGAVRGVVWIPGSGVRGSGVSSKGVNLITGGGEGDVHLWPLLDDDGESTTNGDGDADVDMEKAGTTAPKTATPLATLRGHASEIRALAIHPSGRYLASGSSDTTWNLWDLATSTSTSTSSSTTQTPLLTTQPLLQTEGHTLPIHTLTFSPLGSLLLSGSADALGRIWDLRTGRTIMLLEGHMREIHASDWSGDGYRVLTGSADGLGMCWDLRMVRAVARVPLHSRGVTSLVWWKGNDGWLAAMEGRGEGGNEPARGSTLVVSGGFDKTVAVTSALDWAPVRSLAGHSGHVLCVDVGGGAEVGGKWQDDARYIVSGGYDRTVKIWGRDDGMGVVG